MTATSPTDQPDPSHHSDQPSHDLPRRLVNTRDLINSLTGTGTVDGADGAAPGAVWRLAEPVRDLDSNVIHLAAGDGIEAHPGAGLDVLINVLHGSGTLGTADGPLTLRTGDLLWLPRLTLRSFTAGDDGLVYHTIHQRKPGLQVQTRRPATA